MKADDIVVSLADKVRFPYHTDSAILGIKFIESQPNHVLTPLVGDDKALSSFCTNFPSTTNPSWVIGQVGIVLYERGVIDEEVLDRL